MSATLMCHIELVNDNKFVKLLRNKTNRPAIALI